MRCEVCAVEVYSVRNYEQHLIGKKHRLKLHGQVKECNLSSSTPIDAASRERLSKKMEGIPVLAPGEPVPPGFEDVLNRVSKIQEVLDAHKSTPLIGLEYLIEATTDDDPNNLQYFCLLCDKTGAKRIVISHLNSLNHQMKYLKLYFPSVHNYLLRVSEDLESKKVISKIITGISSKIEQQFGRLKPLAVDKTSFMGKREYYFEKISSEAHFRETPKINLKEVVDVSLPEGNQEKKKSGETHSMEHESPIELVKETSLFHKSKVNVDKTKLRKSYKSFDDSSDNKSLSEKESLLQGDIKPKKINYARKGSDNSITLCDKRRKNLPYDRTITRSEKIDNFHKRREELLSSRLSNISSVSSRSRSRFWSRSLSKSPEFYSERSKNVYRRPTSISNSRQSSSRRYGKAKHRSKSLTRKSSSDHRSHGSHGGDRVGQQQSQPQHTREEKTSWEIFRAEVDVIAADIAATRRRYEKSPEKHPAYASEWKKFCSHQIGYHKGNRVLDLRSREFKFEWIAYWKDRLNVMFDKELRDRKDTVKNKLGLPEDRPQNHQLGRKRKIYHENSYPHNDEHKVSHVEKKSPPKAQRLPSHEKRVTVSDVKITWKALTGSDIGCTPDVKILKEKDASELTSFPSKIEESREKRNSAGLIGTLRLVTALEDQLGSLGPKVNSLLSQALALQRRGSCVDSLLSSSENVILFETVKEKLQGHLQVGTVRRSVVAAVMQAIQTITDLLSDISLHEEVIISSVVKGEPKYDTIPFSPISSRNNEFSEIAECATRAPVPAPGNGEIDKVAIAQQIALALVQEGRTAVSEQELQILVNRFIGMEQAKAQCDADIAHTTSVYNSASILSDLGAAQNRTLSIVNVISPLNSPNFYFNTSSRTSSDSKGDITCDRVIENMLLVKAQEPQMKNFFYNQSHQSDSIKRFSRSENTTQGEYYSREEPFECDQFHISNSNLAASTYNHNTSGENCDSIIKYPLLSNRSQKSVYSSHLNSTPVPSGNYLRNHSNYYQTGYHGPSS